MRSIQLTHLFINEGYLIRGGIDIGLACHEYGNIVGPAYKSLSYRKQGGRISTYPGLGKSKRRME